MKNETIEEHKSFKFKDIQKLIVDKLERSKAKKEANQDVIFTKASVLIPSPTPSHVIPKTTSIGRKSSTNQCLLPPPPPPPPPIPSRPLSKLSNTHKASGVVQLFHSLKSQDAKKDSKGSMTHHYKPITNSTHNSIVGEIQNRLAHLLVADKCVVLKHFKWPEKKANVMREAVVEYHELKMLE